MFCQLHRNPLPSHDSGSYRNTFNNRSGIVAYSFHFGDHFERDTHVKTIVYTKAL